MDAGFRHRLRRRLLKAGHFIGLFIAMSLICLPGLWVVLNSFRPTVEIMAKPPVWIPTELRTLTITAPCSAGSARAGCRS